jgi:N-acyl-D-amino-acid deacylase
VDANITVLNYEGLRDHATYRQPYRANEGIVYVLVNGEIAVMHGKATGATAGKVLRVK